MESDLIRRYAAIKKMINAIGCSKINQPFSCAATISFKFKLPVNKMTPTTDITSGISYEIICAAARMPPKRAYLLLDAQPAGHNSNVVIPEMAI